MFKSNLKISQTILNAYIENLGSLAPLPSFFRDFCETKKDDTNNANGNFKINDNDDSDEDNSENSDNNGKR